ncbi:MAG: PIN domain-containing protein [Candidatus Rokubacteria bacterium]|nr:PIN domain-containing protein [Candidatus Rokubacteria bacterium]
MVASGLIDTGAILAIIDRGDRWHTACADAVRQFRLPLLTSTAVLTELFHLVGDRRRDTEAAWRFVRSGAVTIGAITDVDLPVLDELMQRYRDRPMDFADATLVLLAQRESLNRILTIDHDDFETYRIRGRQRFQIAPRRDGPVVIGRAEPS